MTYDTKADALAINLVEAPSEFTVIDLGVILSRYNGFEGKIMPGINIDFDGNGRLTSIEILGASLHYPLRELKQMGDGAVWLTLAQAAKEAKLSATTLRNQLNSGRLKGRKTGRDWQVSRTVLWNYLESRAPAGKPSAHGKRVARAIIKVRPINVDPEAPKPRIRVRRPRFLDT